MSHQLKGVRGPHGQGQEAACQPDAEDDQPDITLFCTLHNTVFSHLAWVLLAFLARGLTIAWYLSRQIATNVHTLALTCQIKEKFYKVQLFPSFNSPRCKTLHSIHSLSLLWPLHYNALLYFILFLPFLHIHNISTLFPDCPIISFFKKWQIVKRNQKSSIPDFVWLFVEPNVLSWD